MSDHTKDLRRAERRWRSYCTWMRRLQRDWDTHRGPWSPKLTWENGVCTFSPGDRTQRCDCYNLEHPQALRFKDTPHPACSPYECNPRKNGKGREAVPIQELRAQEVEKELHGTSQRLQKRQRLQSPRREKVTCLCGYFLGHVTVPYGEAKYTVISREYGDRRPKCPNCVEKTKARLARELVSMPA